MTKNIFEVVFFSGNPRNLDFRIKQNKSSVSKFLIFCNESNFTQISKELLYDTKTKVYVDNQPLENSKYYSHLIKNKITEIYEDFGDIISFSNNDEIPNFEQIDFDDFHSSKFNQLSQKVYEYSFDYFRKYLEYGTVISDFSNLLQKRNFVENLQNIKKIFPKFVDTKECGIILRNFDKKPPISKTYLCPYSNLDVPLETKQFKKVLILFNNNSVVEEYDYELILDVKTTQNFPESHYLDLNKKINEMKIFVPQKNLYFSEEYEKNYLMNEIKRILNSQDFSEFEKIDYKFPDTKVLNFFHK